MVKSEQTVGFYEQMLRIIVWEQGLLRMIDEGKASGFYHSGRGQEAVAVGACAALRRDDFLMNDHRACGQPIAKGLSLSKLYGDFLANMEGTTVSVSMTRESHRTYPTLLPLRGNLSHEGKAKLLRVCNTCVIPLVSALPAD